MRPTIAFSLAMGSLVVGRPLGVGMNVGGSELGRRGGGVEGVEGGRVKGE